MEAAIAVTAKLHASISAPVGSGVGRRTATHGSGADPDDIAVTIGANVATKLSADDDTMVAAHHGWQGAMYTAATDESGAHAAAIHLNFEARTMGKKFGGAAANGEYEYALTDGALAVDSTQPEVPTRVALAGVP